MQSGKLFITGFLSKIQEGSLELKKIKIGEGGCMVNDVLKFNLQETF